MIKNTLNFIRTYIDWSYNEHFQADKTFRSSCAFTRVCWLKRCLNAREGQKMGVFRSQSATLIIIRTRLLLHVFFYAFAKIFVCSGFHRRFLSLPFAHHYRLNSSQTIPFELLKTYKSSIISYVYKLQKQFHEFDLLSHSFRFHEKKKKTKVLFILIYSVLIIIVSISQWNLI